MRVYLVASSSVAHGLKWGVISVAGLLVLLVRSDDVPAALRSYLLNLGWITAFVVVGVLVLTPIWLRRRRPLPVGTRAASFADVVRPDKFDLVLFIVLVGYSFLVPAEVAAYLAALIMGGAIGLGGQALFVRVWERRHGVVLLWEPGWVLGFHRLYSEAVRGRGGDLGPARRPQPVKRLRRQRQAP